MEENKNEDVKPIQKKKHSKLLIVIAILSTYVVAFLLGRITNYMTLGEKDRQDGDGSSTVTAEPTVVPSVLTQTEFEEAVNQSISIIDLRVNEDWTQLEQLHVFESNFYDKEYKFKVAPGFYGTYDFEIKNSWDHDVTCNLKFKEENEDSVNMVYKVLNEGNYVLGNDDQNVYLDGVTLSAVTVPAHSSTIYRLCWKWEDTDYDTEIGEKDFAQYKLFINLQASIGD